MKIKLGACGAVLFLCWNAAAPLEATTFTKITTGSIVTDGGLSIGVSWGDYDKDGDLDLFVANSSGGNNFLYRNNGDGTFTKVTTGSVVTDGGNSTGCAWGDYDNDGFPDLFVTNDGQSNFLYHNNGDGTFTKITAGAIVTDVGHSYGCAWGDFDKDGFLDLYVANLLEPNFFYHNNGDGTFSKVTSGAPVTDNLSSVGCAWGDYDNDGWLDLFVAHGGNQNNSLYHNNGDGTFTAITTGPVVGDGGYSVSGSWGDYDNDGYLDLYVVNRLGSNFLYHNNGDGTFTKITNGNIVTDIGDSNGCSWGDFNNDGYLDLFVARWNGQANQLFQNNGDGTFTKITTGNIVTDGGDSLGCGWADFDGDGHLDLFAANYNNQNNFLYRNNGNARNWITIQCVGAASNRDGIGARVQVDATIGGVARSQFSQIASGNGWDGSAMVTHFGLGTATVISSLRIEWPSGTVQTFSNVSVNQVLTVNEPPPAQPLIRVQPKSQVVDNGTTVSLSVQAIGAGTLSYQWRLNGNDIPGMTSPTFTLNPVHTTDAGNYTVVVSNQNGSAVSQSAKLTVLTTFTKITSGPVVSDGGNSMGSAWADFDGDGLIDLAVANYQGANFLYKNNGNGSFTPVTGNPVVQDISQKNNLAWGDFDNDDDLDLFVANIFESNVMYRNDSGTFVRLASAPFTNDVSVSVSCSWADYDNDGYLDLFVANGGGAQSVNNFLYHNNGDGTFAKISTGSIVNDGGFSIGCSWVDYDNDGDLDLFVANLYGTNFLYRNDGGGIFTKIFTGSIVTDAASSVGVSWGDYDNDGFFDLFVANGGPDNFLYHNNGDGTFTRITTGSIVNDGGYSVGCAWADYDNDGFLDLAVANRLGNNFLYRNNGDGTFTKVTTGSVVNDGGDSNGVAWGDYNEDGFLDLFISNWNGQNNFLYLNNANANAWIKIKCVGSASNRSGVGAKVKVQATIGGVPRWQVRQIGGFDGFGTTTLDAHFGLGDATTISSLRIEWPSGTVQTFNNVAVNQTLTINEPTASADVSVVMIATPNPVVQGSTITYTIIAANNGPGTAAGVKVTDVLPAGLTFVDASTTAGTISGTSTVVGNLGNMAPNTSAIITIDAVPTPGGSHPATYLLGNTVTITTISSDSNSANNSDSTTSTVRTDTDGDHIPDDWEIQYGLNPNDPADGSIDTDGDGYNNLQEFLLGTNPSQIAISFQITKIERAGTGNNVLVTFLSTSGKNFRAEYSNTSLTGPWTAFADNIPGTGSPVTVTHIGGLLLRQRYYRVVLIP